MGWFRKIPNSAPSGNLWEDFLELLGEWKLLRRGVAISLLVLFWSNWPMMGVVFAAWAMYEAVDYGSDWLKAWRGGKN